MTADVGTATTSLTAPVAMVRLAVDPEKRPRADEGSTATTG